MLADLATSSAVDPGVSDGQFPVTFQDFSWRQDQRSPLRSVLRSVGLTMLCTTSLPGDWNGHIGFLDPNTPAARSVTRRQRDARDLINVVATGCARADRGVKKVIEARRGFMRRASRTPLVPRRAMQQGKRHE